MFKILLATLALGAALFAAQSQAQPQAQMQAQQAPDVDVQSLDKQEVQGFANALVKVDALRQDLQSQIPTQDGKVDETKIQEINNKFQAEATQIIKKENLSLKQYGQYVQLFQTNPEFQQVIKNLLAQNQK